MTDKLKFIGGTNPGSKYLVIAEDHGVALGIRAFVENSPSQVLFGLRIRKEYLNADTAGDQGEVGKFVDKKFPSFHMSMKTYKHGSVATGLPVKASIQDQDGLLAFVNDANGVVAGMVAALNKVKGSTQFSVSEETLADYIRQAYRDDLAVQYDAYQKQAQVKAAAEAAAAALKQKKADQGQIEPQDYSPEDLKKTNFDVSDYMKKLLGKPPVPGDDDTPF